MKAKLIYAACAALSIPAVSHAIDDFSLQVVKAAHEDTSLSHGIYTEQEEARWWDSECPWFQNPMVSLRFNTVQQERDRWVIVNTQPFSETESYSPMVTAGFQTIGGINAGIAYSHSFIFERQNSFLRDHEGEADSVGGYLLKQWNCGFKAGATVSYTMAEQSLKDANRPYLEFETLGASGSVGFARSFGEKKFGRNIFVDTSANGLYESDRFYGEGEEAWYFLWMAKVGHNICERFAVYGLFNLYHEIDDETGFRAPAGFAGYHPYLDETWGETGGGFATSFCHGLSFSAEATIPVLDEGLVANNAFQVRAGLNWTF